MANLNKVMLIGRLTREPEKIMDGRGAKFGFAVNNRKLNQQTQKWEDEPVFIDCEVWNRNEGGQHATRLLENVHKGHQLFIEGRLRFDQWDDTTSKTGKRSALRVVVENFQYLEPRAGGDGDGEGGGQQRAYQQSSSRPSGAQQQPYRQQRNNTPPPPADEDDFDGPAIGTPAAGGRGNNDDDENIPF